MCKNFSWSKYACFWAPEPKISIFNYGNLYVHSRPNQDQQVGDPQDTKHAQNASAPKSWEVVNNLGERGLTKHAISELFFRFGTPPVCSLRLSIGGLCLEYLYISMLASQSSPRGGELLAGRRGTTHLNCNHYEGWWRQFLALDDSFILEIGTSQVSHIQ